MSSDPIPSAPSPISTSAASRIRRRLKRVGPLSAGTTLALLYGGMSLIAAPLLFVMMSATAHRTGAHAVSGLMFGAGFALVIPFLYAAIGFLTGVIGAALYNLFARWTGGIDVEVE